MNRFQVGDRVRITDECVYDRENIFGEAQVTRVVATGGYYVRLDNGYRAAFSLLAAEDDEWLVYTNEIEEIV